MMRSRISHSRDGILVMAAETTAAPNLAILCNSIIVVALEIIVVMNMANLCNGVTVVAAETIAALVWFNLLRSGNGGVPDFKADVRGNSVIANTGRFIARDAMSFADV
mmetsp:Transcript_6647/g.20065  ORF Transcript_6647/g.20065 Transcript_6647/m.20065 type:complete len:108 (+) Transcript_6647:121-444(+)